MVKETSGVLEAHTAHLTRTSICQLPISRVAPICRSRWCPTREPICLVPTASLRELDLPILGSLSTSTSNLSKHLAPQRDALQPSPLPNVCWWRGEVRVPVVRPAAKDFVAVLPAKSRKEYPDTIHVLGDSSQLHGQISLTAMHGSAQGQSPEGPRAGCPARRDGVGDGAAFYSRLRALLSFVFVLRDRISADERADCVQPSYGRNWRVVFGSASCVCSFRAFRSVA